MSTISLPAATAIQIPGPDGAIRGIAWAWPGSDLGLLFLHDLDADLDAVRWLAEPVAAAGSSVLAVDLPGHGLSDGHRRSAAGAVEIAYQALRQEVTGTAAVVAEGRSAGLLLGQELSPAPTAAVLIGPAWAGPGHPRIAPGWRLVPKLVIVPEATEPTDRCARKILDATNAWCLRADLARPGDGGAGDEAFARQATSLTVKFALEQAAFELSARAVDEEDR